jgi:hypothetical protein
LPDTLLMGQQKAGRQLCRGQTAAAAASSSQAVPYLITTLPPPQGFTRKPLQQIASKTPLLEGDVQYNITEQLRKLPYTD